MRAGGTKRDVGRAAFVLVSAVLALAGAAIGSGAFGGTPIQAAAGGALAADATLLAPGGGAFRIWGVIYLGLIAYAVFQALPSELGRSRQRRVGGLAATSMLLNVAWILSVQAGLLAVSVPIIVALLVVLVAIVLRLEPADGDVDRVLLDGVFGLSLGWVSIATVADATAVLQRAGFDGFGLAPWIWAVSVLAVAAAVGIALAVRAGGRFAPALSLAWGLEWIAIARASNEPGSIPVTVVASLVALVVLVAPAAVRARRHADGGAAPSA